MGMNIIFRPNSLVIHGKGRHRINRTIRHSQTYSFTLMQNIPKGDKNAT